MRIRVKFLLIFFISSFLPLILLAYVNFASARQELTKDTRTRLEVIAKYQALRVNEIVNAFLARIDSLSRQTMRVEDLDLFVRTGDAAAQDRLIRSLAETQQVAPDMKTLTVTDARGVVVASTDRSLIGTARELTLRRFDFIESADGAPQLRMQRQILKDGIAVGALELTLRDDLLTEITDDHAAIGNTGEFEIVTRLENGSVFYVVPRHYEQARSSNDAGAGVSPLETEALALRGDSFLQSIDYRGESVVAATKNIPDLGWTLIVKTDAAEAYQSVDALRDVILIFSFIFILVIVLNALLFVYSITAPILNLVSVTQQVRAGDLSKRAAVRTRDEIGELTTSFNVMVGALEESHRDLEAKIEERTEQLSVANKDLEAFTYSVSHDLRAPLRSVDGFSKILEEDHAASFDADGKHVIATIRASAQQMGNLIDDLLAFSRLGRQELKTADVDMTALAKNVFEELRKANPERHIRFVCPDLPPAQADPALMRQVWTNLLSNAVKFTQKKDDATVEVGSVRNDRNTTYFVKDNGVGFDMRYVHKLFVVFQRLHSTQEFEGSGVGLSIVSRIVQKHGGSVRAEGAVNEGATFSFSLPNKRQEP